MTGTRHSTLNARSALEPRISFALRTKKPDKAWDRYLVKKLIT